MVKRKTSYVPLAGRKARGPVLEHRASEDGSIIWKEYRPMLSVLSQEPRDPGAPPATLDFDEAALLNVTDPWHRSKLADDLAKRLADLASTARQIRTEAVRELIGQHGVKHQEVASYLGKSRQRVGQWIDSGAPVASGSEAVA